MLAKSYPYYLANKAVYANEDLQVFDKYSGEVATVVAMADSAVIDTAIAASVKAAEPMAKMAAYERQAVLDHCVMRFRERFDEMRRLATGIDCNLAEADAWQLLGRLEAQAGNFSAAVSSEL